MDSTVKESPPAGDVEMEGGTGSGLPPPPAPQKVIEEPTNKLENFEWLLKREKEDPTFNPFKPPPSPPPSSATTTSTFGWRDEDRGYSIVTQDYSDDEGFPWEDGIQKVAFKSKQFNAVVEQKDSGGPKKKSLSWRSDENGDEVKVSRQGLESFFSDEEDPWNNPDS